MNPLRDCFGDLARTLWLHLADTGVLRYRHVLDSSSIASKSFPQPILMDPQEIPSYLSDVRLVSHTYRSSSIAHYPCIETWALVNGVSRGHAAPYRCIQFHTIRKELNKPVKVLEGSYAVFPHLTSHFGHWVGDQLGAFLWYARQLQTLSAPPRMIAIAPSQRWAEFLIELCPKDSLALLTPQQFLEVNWVLQRAIVLPRMSPWQNLSLVRDCLLPYLLGSETPLSDSSGPRRIFLCSQRHERILNLEAVQGIFQEYGYAVLSPTSHLPQRLLHWIREASSLWCEQGSMVMNALLSRNRPYRVFELSPLNSSLYPRQLQMLGGGIYNSFHLGLIQPFYCHPAVNSRRLDRQLHPYQRQLVVNLDALRQELASERMAAQ